MAEQMIRREHDSMDDFEHLEHIQDHHFSTQEGNRREKLSASSQEQLDTEKDMISFGVSQNDEPVDTRMTATLSFLESERTDKEGEENAMKLEEKIKESPVQNLMDDNKSQLIDFTGSDKSAETLIETVTDVKETTVPAVPTVSAQFLKRDFLEVEDKPVDTIEKKESDIEKKERISIPTETRESEFELEAPTPPPRDFKSTVPEVRKQVEEVEIAPKEIFSSIGIDAWFNPERLNPKVAALIYWRDTKKSGAVFSAILGVLLSLAYFSLISVLAYLSLLVLTGTIAFRIYKTVLQAVQKTSDGHPFKEILELDLTLPTEKVHQVADVAVAHANAAVVELRRLFLVEDFIDSMKFGVLLWCLTYVGSLFNGMTLIIMGVVALFTLPKVYETNKAQIDQNMALVHGKINELTAKVKAAIPLGKKAEPTKEE